MPKRSTKPITSRIPGLRFAGRVVLRLADWLRSAAGTSFGGGWLAGLFGVAFCHQLFAPFGGGLMTSGGSAAAVAIALLAATIGARRGRQLAGPSLVAALIPAVWALSINWLAGGVESACHSLDLELLASPWGQFGAAFGAALLLLGIPAACAARVALQNVALDGFWVISGAAIGCLTAAYGFGPLFGVQWAGLIAAGLTVAWAIRIAAIRWRAARVTDAIVEGPSSVSSAPDLARIVIGSFVAGLSAAALVRLVQQLMPGTEAVEWTACAGFLLGVAAIWRSVHPEFNERRLPRAAVMVLGLRDRLCDPGRPVPVSDGSLPRGDGHVLERVGLTVVARIRRSDDPVRGRRALGRRSWLARRRHQKTPSGLRQRGSRTFGRLDRGAMGDPARGSVAVTRCGRRLVAGDICRGCDHAQVCPPRSTDYGQRVDSRRGTLCGRRFRTHV